MGIFTGLLIVFGVAVVYRVCKVCWQSTKHYVYDDNGNGTKTYKCTDCGATHKEEDYK